MTNTLRLSGLNIQYLSLGKKKKNPEYLQLFAEHRNTIPQDLAVKTATFVHIFYRIQDGLLDKEK